MSMVERSDTADLLKGTAVVLMIQVHVMELFALPAVLESGWGKLSLLLGGPPAAPVFLAVMGYFGAASPKSTGRLVLRGIKLLALGFLLNLGMNAHLLVKIAQGAIRLDPWPYILGVDILFVAGASTVLLAVLRPALRRSAIVPALAAVLVAAAAPRMTAKLITMSGTPFALAYVAGNYFWSYFPWFPWMAYPLVGFAWRGMVEWAGLGSPTPWGRLPICHAEGRLATCPTSGTGETSVAPAVSTLWLWAGAIACGVVAAATWRFGATVATDLPRYYHHGLGFFLWTCAFLAAWVAVHAAWQAKWGNSAVATWLEALGRNVTLCYVVQWLIVGNLATALYKGEPLPACGLAIVAVVSVTSLFSAFLGRKRPAAKGAAAATGLGDVG
jgi:hypothetical protein